MNPRTTPRTTITKERVRRGSAGHQRRAGDLPEEAADGGGHAGGPSGTALPPELPQVAQGSGDRERYPWLAAVGLLLAVFALIIALAGFAAQLSDGYYGEGDGEPAAAAAGAAGSEPAAGKAATGAGDETAKSAAKVEFEKYERPDPALPAIPAGPVKNFRVDVLEHVTKVSDDLPATRVWSYAINGKTYRGTGVSTPMVVEVGDKVHIELVNGGSKAMDVKMPHSIDYHSSEIAPNVAFKTVGPGEKHSFDFVAEHPGVYMYHCATDPVLQHTGEGMVGMMIVKPKDLAPAKEFWINQQEFYVGAPGELGDYEAMQAKNPNVIAFNGYASQYKKNPIKVAVGEKVRVFVLNSGPSIWSAFHVIGTVFDKTMIEGTPGRHAQTVNLAPSQGGWVEFTLAEPGKYPFVTHAFGDTGKGAVGVFQAGNGGPKTAGH